MNRQSLLLALAIAACPLAASAQDAAAAASVTDSGLTAATPNCKKPDIAELTAAVGDGSSVAVQDASRIKSPKKKTVTQFQQEFDDYRTCVVTFAQTQSALAKKHNEIANNAVNELNAFVAEANKAQNRQ